MDLGQWLRLGWDRVGAWVCVVAGAVVLLLGWVGVSDKLYTAEQLPYVISDGFGGLFLLGLGGILWLSADLRDEWTQLDKIEELLELQQAGAGDKAGEWDDNSSRRLVGSVK